MKQGTELSFKGQNIYCGLDVHKKNWSVCVRDENMELKTFSQPPDADILVKYLRRNYPDATYHAVYEAGFSGYWAQRKLSQQGVDCIVTHAADVPSTDKEKRRKTDQVDCRKLAKNLSDHSAKSVYIPSEQMVDDRGIIRTRQQLVKDQTRCKNRLTSWLNFYGISIPEGYKQDGYFTKKFIVWLEALEVGPNAKKALQLKLDTFKYIRQELQEATKQIREMAKTERYQQQVTLLRSVPGIGLINAMVFLGEIGDIRRFKTLDHLCGYIGLVPDIYSSNDNIIIKGITPRCNHSLREALVESAWCAMRKDPALLMAYKKYIIRMNANKAIIKVAKKLLNRIRYVLLKQEKYVSCIVQ
jgi:transposase